MKSKFVFALIIFSVCLSVYFLVKPDEVALQKFDLISPADLLKDSDDTDRRFFSSAVDVIDFSFPQDHGSHKDFQTEWWYFTGNLEGDDGNHYGYQATIFRSATESPFKFNASQKESEWGTNQIYMAHLGLTDVANNKFYSFEKYSRDVLGLAGSQSDPDFKVWVGDWFIKHVNKAQVNDLIDNSYIIRNPREVEAEFIRENKFTEEIDKTIFPLKIKFVNDELELNLKVSPSKPLILQGDRGLSKKSSIIGNASYYYSITRLSTVGKIKFFRDEFKSISVTGSSWFDREWSTSALAEDQAGWDWFSLQLDNDVELMYYQLRLNDGTIDPNSQGAIIDSEGNKHVFYSDDINIKVTDYYQSKYSSARYPVEWRLKIPSLRMELKLKTVIKDQEHKNSLPYYEGALKISGGLAKKSVDGYGYIEMVGY